MSCTTLYYTDVLYYTALHCTGTTALYYTPSTADHQVMMNLIIHPINMTTVVQIVEKMAGQMFSAILKTQGLLEAKSNKMWKVKCEKFESVHGIHVPVVQRAGKSVRTDVTPEPFRKARCGRENCITCTFRQEAEFAMKVIICHQSSLGRQIHNAAWISRTEAEIILNSK